MPSIQPPKRDPDVAAAFQARKRRQVRVSVPFAILLVFLVVRFRAHGLAVGEVHLPATALALPIVVGLLIFSVRNWRCPACDRYLGKSMAHRSCPHCGAAFE
jgi:hypothetical protein